MYYLLAFLRKYYYLLVFLLLEGISFWMLFRFNSYQGSVWFSSANTAVASINRFHQDCLSYFNLETLNRDLTSANVLLQEENNRLRELLALQQQDTAETTRNILHHLEKYEHIPALVVSASDLGSHNYLVINRGENDGIRPEMGVVSGNGVVGIVYLTGPDYSLVMPVVNHKSSISCRVRGQRYFGYLLWDGKDKRKASVDDIPRYAKIKKGDIIETSGYSSVFPPGIYVGRIHDISNSADGQAFRLGVDLGTDFSRLRDVNVIVTPYKAEIDTLFKKAREIEENLN